MTDNATQKSYTGTEFEHDIFVSYSHGRPPERGGDSDLKTWTHELIVKLQEHIGYSLEVQKQPIKVWYDAKLSGNVALTEKLKHAVENSATLLIVMTRNYLSSEWCEKEREWFENEIERRGGGIENVFVVRAMATEGEDWPDFLKDGFGETVLGFRFCEEAKGKAARPFGWVKPTDSSTQREFIDSLTDLASNMATRLDEIRKKSYATYSTNDRSKAGIPPESTSWPVLVAPGTDDVQSFSKQVREQLKQKGCMLLPPEEIKIEHFTQEDPEQSFKIARAFVQLIGIAAAREEGKEIGRVQLLNQCARQHSIHQFMWRNSKIPLAALDDQTYKQFVESLGDIPERTIHELTDDVIEYLRSQDSMSVKNKNLFAYYMEVPAKALDEFDRWKKDIITDDCLLLPLKAPVGDKMKQIRIERKYRQLVFGECKAVLLIYCIANQLKWLTDTIFNFLKDTAMIRRKGNQSPEAVVIDYVGEARILANIIGVKVISRKEGSDPRTFWQQLNGIVA
ncbi:MAG: toll/interleukin-1 receptor domain-containing protein [Candidatus Hermodarchaeia archaeon]|jgi:hypothetical protein